MFINFKPEMEGGRFTVAAETKARLRRGKRVADFYPQTLYDLTR
jgi:hypothetical protein